LARKHIAKDQFRFFRQLNDACSLLRHVPGGDIDRMVDQIAGTLCDAAEMTSEPAVPCSSTTTASSGCPADLSASSSSSSSTESLPDLSHPDVMNDKLDQVLAGIAILLDTPVAPTDCVTKAVYSTISLANDFVAVDLAANDSADAECQTVDSGVFLSAAAGLPPSRTAAETQTESCLLQPLFDHANSVALKQASEFETKLNQMSEKIQMLSGHGTRTRLRRG